MYWFKNKQALAHNHRQQFYNTLEMDFFISLSVLKQRNFIEQNYTWLLFMLYDDLSYAFTLFYTPIKHSFSQISA